MTAPPRSAPSLAQQRDDLSDRLNDALGWLSEHSLEIVVAIAVGLLIVLVLTALKTLACRLIGGAGATGWRAVADKVVGNTGRFFIVMVAVELVTDQVELSRGLRDITHLLFVVAAAMQAAIWTRALVIGLVEQRVGDGVDNRNLGTAMGLIRALVTAAVFLIAVIVILDNLDVDVTGLIAGLGIGGIAIGLAAQGIFSDLFAALAIIFDRPFRRGDTINVAGFVGTVENIGLKTTRLRALDGELVAFGNAKLLENRVHNYALQERRRAVMQLSLAYHTPPELLAALPSDIQAIVARQPHVTFDRAHLWQFAPSSIDLELVFFMETADYGMFMQARQEIMLALLRRFAELGVAHAYPTQTTFTAAPDGELVMPWPPALADPAGR